jgi:hypothetical protein
MIHIYAVRPWLRTLVACATVLVAWLVAWPARAAAPLCDDRGASMVAPEPQLQAPELSLKAVGADEDDACALHISDETARQAPPRAPPPQSAQPQATVPTGPARDAAAYYELPRARDTNDARRPGFTHPLERPPRA